MTPGHLVVVGMLLLAFLAPPATEARQATPEPDSATLLADELSPLELRDALLATPFPADLTPSDVGRLQPYEWNDANDADLAGAVGGVILADGDPGASDIPNAITYLIYPDETGPVASLASFGESGEPRDLLVDQQTVPALFADLGEFVAVFAARENVLVYGVAPAGGNAEETATALAEAGISHVVAVASRSADGDATPAATPGMEIANTPEALLLALAAAPFPEDDLPFMVGSLVVLPRGRANRGSDAGLVGALVVRDADRHYPYPLVVFNVYPSAEAARRALTPSTGALATPAITTMPLGETFTYSATLVDFPSESSEVRVQAGPVVVIGNGPRGSLEERHATATTLAKIGVAHLEDIARARGIPMAHEPTSST